MQKRFLNSIIKKLQAGAAGVMPTDTIYGIVGSARNKKTVEKIYRLRKRNLKKPMIILIASIDDLAMFGVKIDKKTEKILERVWPGKVSVVLSTKEHSYLHRGTKTLAFRMPRPRWLHDVLLYTGPLVAPSANFEGEPPARTIYDARKYFGKRAAFYLDAGVLASKPSTLVAIKKGKMKVLREGAVRI